MKKILLVDNHAGILRVLARELEICGFEVITARNGEEALRTIYNGVPDLVLLDIMMPVMNGFEMLSELRKFSGLPVIADSFDECNKEQALKSGADDFILKPFETGVLLDKVRCLLS